MVSTRYPPGLAAVACFVAAVLFTADLLLGGLTLGAHLDAPVTGRPLILVDALGLVTYLSAMLLLSFVFYAVGRRAIAAGGAQAVWRASLAVPLAAIALLFVRFGVGQEGLGSRTVTALLVGFVAALVSLLSWLQRSTRETPGQAAFLGMVLAMSAWLWLNAVGQLDLSGDARETRMAQVGTVVAWLGVLGASCLVQLRGGLRFRLLGIRRIRIAAIGVCAPAGVLWLALSSPPGVPGTGDGPNVVLVVFDAMRADRLSTYGGRVPTPNFDELASEGVAFEQAYAQAPWTVPSMVSLFSSDYPELPEGSAPRRDFTIPESAECLSEALSARGYATGAITANYALGEHTGILQGFSEKVVINHHLRRRNVFSQALPGLEALVYAVAGRPESDCLMDTSPVILQHLEKFLKRSGSGPFYVWLHFMDPHDPYAPPTEYRSGVVREDGPWPVFAPHDPAVGTPTDTEIRAGNVHVDEPTREYISDLYDAEIAYADDLLGQVRATVGEASGERDVIWCVLSDHGEDFWEHGSYYHGQSLYQELIHVPLLFAGKGISQALRVPESVSLIDVMPTLFDLCAMPIPPGYLGRTLVSRLAGGEPLPLDPVFSDSNFYYEPAEAVIDGEYKLIREIASGRMQLYDLGEDPAEQDDVAADKPEVCERLAQILDAWRTRQRRQAEPEGEEERPEHIERLRTLGYL